MLLFSAILLLSNALDVSYLNFSSTTNPKNSTIDLSISSVSDQSYSIEFWMRPLFKSTDKGSFTVLTISNDWKALYTLSDSSLTIGSTTNGDYCRMSKISSNFWNHIAITYNKDTSKTISCYVNSTLQYTTSNANTVAKSPDTVKIGGAFYGNLFDLRIWLNKCLVQYEIEKNFTFYLTSPYPSKLKKYYRLIEESSNNILKEYVAGTTKSFSTSNFINIWKKESPGSLILCAPGYYLDNGECVKCPSLYAFCKGPEMSLCYNTTRSFIDFSNSDLSDKIKLNFYTNVLTIEFWFYPLLWETNLELLSISNLISIKQRGSDSIVAIYDGSGNEVHNFTSNLKQWVHIAWVHQSNNKAYLYINRTSKLVSWTNSTPSSNLYLGGSTTASRFKGKITDFRLWTTERSSYNILSNINTNYTISSSPTELIEFCPLSDTGKKLDCKIKTFTFSSLTSTWLTQDCTSENCLFLCPYKNYFNLSLGECKNCDTTCQACSGPNSNQCTACLSTDFTIPDINSCYTICPLGYVGQGYICQLSCNIGYYNNSGICILCNSICSSCLNETYCTNCIIGYSIYPLIAEGVCKQDCEKGKFLDLSSICKDCNTSCITCYGNTNNCTSCPTGQYLYNGICYVSCPLYTYVSSTNCYDCHISCYSCIGSSNTDCVECKENYGYTDNLGICYEKCPGFYNETSKKCLSACPVGTYPQENNICDFCDNSCLECTGPSNDECSKCPEKIYENVCMAQCPSNTFDNNGVCEICSSNCLTCFESADNCTSCPTSQYIYKAYCYSECPDETHVLEAYNSCVETCPDGYYLINNQCEPCDNSCRTCQTTSTTCTSCSSDLLLYINLCMSKCPDGFYPKDHECTLCSPTCKTCSDYNFCLSCSDTNLYIDSSIGTCNSTCNISTYILEKSCVSSCPNSYYTIENPKTCLSCPNGCLDCSSSLICGKCSDNYLKLGTICVLTCPENNYYANYTGMECGICDINCVQCNGDTLADCTVCAGGKVVYVNDTGIGKCLDSCPEGTFLSGTMCKNCIENCESCSDSTTCLECYSGYYLQGNKTCGTYCDYGDIMNNKAFSCISYTKIHPYGPISMFSFAVIKISYDVAIKKALGNFNVYSIDNGVYTQVLNYDISYETTVNLGNSIATSILSSSYNYNTYYTIEVTSGAVTSSFGTNIEIPKGIWTFYIKPYASEQLVVVINSSIRGTEVKINDELKLDGSKSYDPSSGHAKTDLFSLWGCEDFTSSYAEYNKNFDTSWADYINTVSENDPKKTLCSNWDYENPPDNTTIFISNFTAIGEVLKFTYTLSDNINRTTTKNIFVLIVAEDANPISFQSVPIYKVNIDKEFQLFASNPIINNNVQYKWSVISSGLYPKFTTPLSSWVLAIASDSMSQDTEYIFSLTYSDSITKSSAIITIITNSPPNSGTIYIDLITGTALINNFTSQMIGWVDIDLPLTYSFAISSNTSSVSYIISGLQTSNEIMMVFPGGFGILTGFCYDSLGARSEESIVVEVDFLHDLDVIDEEISKLPNVVDENNVFYIMPIIGCLANELNWTYNDTSIVFEEKSTILALLNQSKIVADTMYIENADVNSLYLYSAIVGIIEVLIKNPINNDLMSSSLSLLISINYSRIEIKPIIYPINNSTFEATSPQYIFHNDIIINLSYTLLNIIDYISSYTNSSLFLGQIPDLIIIAKEILSLGSIITEDERVLVSDKMSFLTSKSLVSSLENLSLTMSSGVSVKIPQNLSSSISSTQVSIVAAYIKTNPFGENLPVLNSYIFIELQDLATNELISVSNLEIPFLISFNITRDILEDMSSQITLLEKSTSKLNVKCTYWDSSTSTWATNGCSLSNLPDVYKYFQYETIPESFTLICSCYHLSQFSISFASTSSTIDEISYIIKEESTIDFKSNQWETTVVLYLMVCGFIGMSLAMGFAYYWDKYNPGLRLPSVETEKTYRYWDPNKVDAVLGQLEKEFIRQKTDSSKSDKKDTNAAINKFLTSGLVSKLMLENTKDNRENYDESLRAGRLHPIEAIMDVDSDDETTQSKTKKYLKKPMDDPRYLTSLVSMPKPRQVQSRRDLEGTIAQLKLHLSHLESNTQVKSPVDLFLEKYDESTKLTSILKSKLKVDHRELKRSDLKALGINPSEFTALRATKSGQIVSDCSMLTGGKYCNSYSAQKILEEVRRFYGSLKMSYWSLFLMYIKKEHKYLSLAFNLHIEYSKKQMIALFSVYWYLQLLLCQIFITYFNWEKTYDKSNKCTWGCYYEAEIFAGVMCGIFPWPVYYICKYLFARNMVEYAAPYATKTQAYQNKICREFVGIILSFLSIFACVVGICAVSIRDPFDTDKGKEFLYCYMASLVWSFFIGEFFATLIKTWLVWKASSENFNKEEGAEPSCWARFAKGMLTLFPCLLPTEL